MPNKIILILKSKLILFFSLGGASLALIWATSSGQKQTSPLPAYLLENPHTISSKSSPSGLPAGLRLYNPEAGQRYIYSFQRKIAFQGGVGISPLPEVAYHGEFYIDVLRADAHGFEALVSQNVVEAKEKISAPVRIEVSARGDELALFTSSLSLPEERQNLPVTKDLLALWLFPLRFDTVGNYSARFEEAAPEGAFSREQKIKLSYLSNSANTPELLSSLHLLRWDQSLQLPAAIQGTESTRLGQGTSAFIAASSYQLNFLKQELSPQFDHALLASLHQNGALSLGISMQYSEHPDYAKLNWDTLLNQLQNLDSLAGPEQLAVFGDLLRYLRAHPGKASELAALLRDPALLKLGSSSPIFKAIVGALATAGTEECLAALRDAYEDKNLLAPGKGTILAAITTTQATIDAATREFLAEKMRSETDPHLAQGAAFALGSSLQNAVNDNQSQNAIQQITNSWQTQAAEHNTGEQLALLDVMGNSGRSEFFPLLQSVISYESDAAIRARAVYSLRFIKGSEAAHEMAAKLGDKEIVVREAAAGAIKLTEWNESFRPALEHCSQSESVIQIQDACRKTLADNTRVAATY